MRHFVLEHQNDWDGLVAALAYEYSALVHRSTGAAPSCSVLTHESLISKIGPVPDDIRPAKGMRTKVVNMKLLTPIQQLMDSTDAKLENSQADYKRHHDRKVCAVVYGQPGQFTSVDRTPVIGKKNTKNQIAKFYQKLWCRLKSVLTQRRQSPSKRISSQTSVRSTASHPPLMVTLPYSMIRQSGNRA